MSKIAPILMIGFGLFVGGLYYHLWSDSITFIDRYIINDEYYTLIHFIWNAIPVIILLVGIIWLIREGTKGGTQKVVYE